MRLYLTDENEHLRIEMQRTLTGACNLLRRSKVLNNGVPSNTFETIRSNIPCAINHWEEAPGNIVGEVAIKSANRFIGHLYYSETIYVGDRIVHNNTTYVVDAVNTPVTIQICQQIHLTVIS